MGPQCYAVNAVRPQLDELLFFPVEDVSVESVEVSDTVVRVEARTTAGRAACPGCGCWSDQPRDQARHLQALPRPALAGRLHQCLEVAGGESREQGSPDGYGNVRNYVSRTLLEEWDTAYGEVAARPCTP
ncbi:hypothetical protein STRIP9103_02871 [Streptomyces ipomoeae 91-03]|uniref:Transposase IS204/IS1001/IS1096/IS1165 zinc-finger domain-containing protein n=1 Tax=Streptomyces ipomoeae 91-03 TaxID=698759 RepID=L1L007_9ACTN|nr:hypothetical protein STRIP9103_02871 [Streptomyces ipomoeae 91-03]